MASSATKKKKVSQVFDLTVDNDSDDDVQCLGFAVAPAKEEAAKKPESRSNKNITSYSRDLEMAKALAAKENYDMNASFSSDLEMAKALAANEKCSQFLPGENNQKRRGTKRRLFECGICLEDNVPGFQGFTLDDCKHRFCRSCLVGLIQSSISGPGSASTTKIGCPAQKCTTNLTLTDIRYILQDHPADFQRYADMADLSRLESEAQDDNSDTRRCPAERCNYIFVFSPGSGAEGRHFECPDCKSSFCLQCGANDRKVGPAHPDKTCADRREQLEEEAEERRKFQEWKRENSQADARFNEMLKEEEKQGKTLPCPKCKAVITKNGGCKHMHCTACNTSFNWTGR